MQSLCQRLANYAARLKYEDLDSKTVHEVRRRLIDSLACALGAYDAHAPQAARNVSGRCTAEPGATFLGGETKDTTKAQFSR